MSCVKVMVVHGFRVDVVTASSTDISTIETCSSCWVSSPSRSGQTRADHRHPSIADTKVLDWTAYTQPHGCVVGAVFVGIQRLWACSGSGSRKLQPLDEWHHLRSGDTTGWACSGREMPTSSVRWFWSSSALPNGLDPGGCIRCVVASRVGYQPDHLDTPVLVACAIRTYLLLVQITR